MPSLKDFFLTNVAQTSANPLMLEITRSDGVCLYDINNKEYIDLISGISVSNTGHSNKKITEAIQSQLQKHLHLMVYGEYIISPQVNLAKKIAELTGNKLDSVFFVNSGSEAIEGAIKLSRRFNGRKRIVACRKAYHGSTLGAMSLIDNTDYTNKFQPDSGHVDFITFNDVNQVNTISEKTSCVIIEPVQGEAGYIPANLDFIARLREKCNETGTLLVFDEAQSGMGRTGKFFAYQHYNVTPDILVLAKALGGGLPLGAFAAPKEIMGRLSFEPPLGHITTFGGHPLSCSASLASIDFILENGLCEHIPEKENIFRTMLNHKEIINVRGKGLMLAVQLSSDEKVQKCITGCLAKGVITDWFLFCGSALRIAPPLIISEEQILHSCRVILETLDNL